VEGVLNGIGSWCMCVMSLHTFDVPKGLEKRCSHVMPKVGLPWKSWSMHQEPRCCHVGCREGMPWLTIKMPRSKDAQGWCTLEVFVCALRASMLLGRVLRGNALTNN